MNTRDAPRARPKGEKQVPAFFLSRVCRRRLLIPAILILGVAAVFWPVRELRSDNFVFYFPSKHRTLPVEVVGGVKFLPLMPVLNLVGSVAGIQEKKNSLKVFFDSTQIEVKDNDTRVEVEKSRYDLPEPVHQSGGQWMVPVQFLTIVLTHLTHQPVEYQQGTDRIFIGDVRPESFTVRLDPLANGARLSVQFTDKVALQTASSNGKWVVFLGDRPMEPMEPDYHFQNPYISDVKYDDQDGVPKLVISPAANGLNFYPTQAEGGKVLVAQVLKPPSATAQVPPPSTPPGAPPGVPGAEAPANPAAAPPAPLPVVVLDPGHGGSDNGTHSHDGIWEKDVVMQYAARARAALLATNKFQVVLTRSGDAKVTFEQRALAANTSNAAYFVSFHAGDLGTAAERICVYTYEPPAGEIADSVPLPPRVFVPWPDIQAAHLEQSRVLAQALQQQFATINGVEADSPTGAPERTLRSVNAPAVAIELGGLTPDTNATQVTNGTFQQQVAQALAQALAGMPNGGAKP